MVADFYVLAQHRHGNGEEVWRGSWRQGLTAGSARVPSASRARHVMPPEAGSRWWWEEEGETEISETAERRGWVTF